MARYRSKQKLRYKHKKGIRRRHKRHVKRGTIVQKQLLVSDRQFVKLSYQDVTTPTLTGTVSSNSNQYILNGLYDFNTAVASTSIPGYAEWITMYNNYRVHYVKLQYECVNDTDNGGNGYPIYMWAQFTPTAPTYSTWTGLMEMAGNRYFKYKALSCKGGLDKGKISMSCNLGQLLGNKIEYNTSEFYAGQSGSNPSRAMYGDVGIATLDGTSAVNLSAYIKVRFVLYCEFYNRRTLTA